jgi:hypothetical protein
LIEKNNKIFVVDRSYISQQPVRLKVNPNQPHRMNTGDFFCLGFEMNLLVVEAKAENTIPPSNDNFISMRYVPPGTSKAAEDFTSDDKHIGEPQITFEFYNEKGRYA